MFLEKLLRDNYPLAELALRWQQDGTILPDTYILDLDTICENGRRMAQYASEKDVKLYFMLKQLGRNPLVAQALAQENFSGAVCVDYREARTMLKNGIPLGNVGHLVQTPHAMVREILAARPQIMTIYSLEKAAEIDAAAGSLGLVQPVMLRVLGEKDLLYSGQYGGFALGTLEKTVKALQSMKHLRIAGVCSFPCFLYNEEAGDICPTPNLQTVCAAAEYLHGCGCTELQLNMPSATCLHTIDKIAAAGGTQGEPGHGLTGTTPYHATHDAAEKLGYVYVSEVSHNVGDKAYCYGGGHYRRGYLKNALVGTSMANARIVAAVPPTDESIDYHFELEENCAVSAGVLMCFRTQIFVTRSEVAVVRGLSEGKPELAGIYSALGDRLR